MLISSVPRYPTCCTRRCDRGVVSTSIPIPSHKQAEKHCEASPLPTVVPNNSAFFACVILIVGKSSVEVDGRGSAARQKGKRSRRGTDYETGTRNGTAITNESHYCCSANMLIPEHSLGGFFVSRVKLESRVRS